MTPRSAVNTQKKRKPSQHRKFSRRSLLGGIGGVGIGVLAGCTGTANTDAVFSTSGDNEQYRDAATESLTTATLYKTPSCECCLEYTAYLEETTEADIEVVEVDDLSETKDEYNIPPDVESCHTVDAGAYFVEGHVPREAIGKLAVEGSNVAGIALPDMPQGSPGMPGEKEEEFVIYAVYDDGSYAEFMTI